MKSRIFIAVLAVVVAVHALLFFLPRGDDSPETPDPPAADPSTETAPARDSTSESTSGQSGAAVSTASGAGDETEPDDASSAVEEAVAVVERAESRAPRSPDETPLSPNVEPSETASPLELGVVEGTSKLTPEIRDLAQSGAKAVAAQQWQEARDIYLEMVELAPDNALAHANLGVSEYQLGNLLAASGNLQKSLRINPSIARNWQTLGLIHYRRGELEMAISSLTRAIHEEPSDARSRLYLAAVVRDYGWDEAAVTELQRAVETDPELADAHYNLAVTYLDEDPPRVELARRHYFAAIDLGAQPSAEIEAAFAERAE